MRTFLAELTESHGGTPSPVKMLAFFSRPLVRATRQKESRVKPVQGRMDLSYG
jgi:hypothetical protein